MHGYIQIKLADLGQIRRLRSHVYHELCAFDHLPALLVCSARAKPSCEAPLYADVICSVWLTGAWALPYASLEPKNVFTVSGANVMSNPPT